MRDQDLFLEKALVEEGLLDSVRLAEAKRTAVEQSIDLVDALVKTQMVSGRDIALTKADLCEIAFVDLQDYDPCYANTQLIPRAVAERYCAFPLFMIDGVLTLAMDNPLNLEATDQVRQMVKCDVDPVLCERQPLRELIARAYSLSHGQQSGKSDHAVEKANESLDLSEPVVAAVNQLLADAVTAGASDIHINPDEQTLHLRYRIDGALQTRQGPALSMHASIVQRLKVMANLDLTQTRRPQDGKFRVRTPSTGGAGEVQIDVRISTMPTVCGENVVMRLLASNQTIHDFPELGAPAPIIQEVEDILNQPYGMFLVTGPTGSGKTTTLYSALSKLNDPSRNIMTIEDPVEIRLPYVRQIQVHPEIGLTFAAALRSILRQDPDVVLVGEIRDAETATIALQSALTGHMVLSTVHTNDSVGAVSRLRDFGLPSFVINSALLGVLAQRLVRRVCPNCTSPWVPDALIRKRFGISEKAEGFVRGRGCGRCSQTGYRGRIGLYEMLTFNPMVKALVDKGSSTDRLREAAVSAGMRLMWQDGLDKAMQRLTTLDEVATATFVIQIEQQLAESARAAA
jgi:type IV pilus assembly protein PilB